MTAQQSTDQNAKKDFRFGRQPILLVFLILTGICFIFSISLYYLEVHPRYINLQVLPPEDQFGQGGWSFTTHSIQTDSFTRIFIVHRKGYVSNGNRSHLTWTSIVSYFDEKLSRLGWVRSEIFAECNIWLPEAEFLHHGENGYVTYFRKGYEAKVTFGANFVGDTVCLAIWPSSLNDGGLPTGFNIVLLTAKRSFFTQFFESVFDG